MSLESLTQERFDAISAQLLSLPVGSQRSLGGGIHLRLNSYCKPRFTFRWRKDGIDRSRTFDTLAEAVLFRLRCCVAYETFRRAVALWD